VGDEFGDGSVVSDRSQVARLRRLATTALGRYDLAGARLNLVDHGENTTFRVTSVDGAQFLLRVHRPNRHGREVDSSAAVVSELQWLAAIRADTLLAVPDPVPSTNGEMVTTATAQGVDGPRVCSLLRWMKRSNHSRSARPIHLERLGGVLAQLHNHADAWVPPDGFVRIRWDHEAFFGNVMVYGNVDAADAWTLLPANLRRTFTRVAEHLGGVMQQLGEDPDAFGLIHADAHLDNVLFDGDRTPLIDFDDRGFGYRIYEVAVALWELRHRSDYSSFEEAFVRGYTRHRPLPPEQRRHLDAFIAAREVAFGLWLVGMAESRASFREQLPTELAHIERSLGIVLGRARN